MATQPGNRHGDVSIPERGDAQEIMLRESIRVIDVEVMRTLIADRMCEGKTLEFKRGTPGGSDGERV